MNKIEEVEVMKFSNRKGDLVLIDKYQKKYNLTIIKYFPNTAEIEQKANICFDGEEFLSFCSEINDVN